jgi:DNA polymerase III subunit delta'
MNSALRVEGQERVVSVLSSHLETDSLSHAYLFLGNEGVGKEYLAKRFAKLLLCSEGDEQCQGCLLFDKGGHPDFIHVDGSSGIKIERVREVIERINLSPNLSKKKVILLSRAEKLGHEAANALLKTLEEPPGDSVIILTAVSEKSLPSTIVSRTQKLKLKDWSLEEIKKVLLTSHDKEAVESALEIVGSNLGAVKKFLTDKTFESYRKTLYDDVETYFKEESLLEKFKIIERHDKEKDIKIFFDLLSQKHFFLLANKIKGGASAGDIEKLAKSCKKILKIYENLNYNVNLRTAIEELTIEANINE